MKAWLPLNHKQAPFPGNFVYDYTESACWVWVLEVRLENVVKLIAVYTPPSLFLSED